jgi:coenzyme F420-0:L-glutamate ligase/coenzyme F420-1:gamma-L-glutamate ligase
VLDDYAGRVDAYGNELRVTARAVADEVAAAADLVKEKVAGRPVAVVRGLPGLVVAEPLAATPSSAVIRPVDQDMFARGTREAVLAAVLTALGRPERYEQLVALEGEALVSAVLAVADRDDAGAELIRAVLRAAEYGAA